MTVLVPKKLAGESVVLVTAAVAILYWGPRWREARRALPLLVVPAAIFMYAIRKHLFAMWGISNR